MALLLLAVALTTAVEALVYRALICPGSGAALAVSAAINLITVGPANLVYSSLVLSGSTPVAAFVLVEVVVVLIEVPLIRSLAGVRWMPSVGTAVAANVCSMSLSALM